MICENCNNETADKDSGLCSNCMWKEILEAMAKSKADIQITETLENSGVSGIQIETSADELDYINNEMDELGEFLHEYAGPEHDGIHVVKVAKMLIEQFHDEKKQYERKLKDILNREGNTTEAKGKTDAERFERIVRFYADKENYKMKKYGRNIDLDQGLIARHELDK